VAPPFGLLERFTSAAEKRKVGHGLFGNDGQQIYSIALSCLACFAVGKLAMQKKGWFKI
jgi:hypothetical protein